MSLEPLSGLRVVDLFAGSGALGIEALSRGAAWVDFAESGAEARRALERNLQALGIEGRARIWAVTLPRGLSALRASLLAADLVLADPPYGGEEAAALMEALAGPAVLRPGARVVIEHHAKDPVPERVGSLACARRRRYGETVISTYRQEESGLATEEER